MSLTKYFNKNYFKENIKKSKGLIALLVIIVPLITILSILLLINPQNYTKVLYENEIIWANLICMYIIPVALSFILFGYVYKKSSVDFINSMPLNRKTIFITNTVAGIFLITLIQILTLIVAFLCSTICSTIYIFPQMIIDIFINMWISYLFIFSAANLAMTFSGTFLTQIVLTMLILFLVPFAESMFKITQIRIFDYEMINNLGDDTTYERIIDLQNQNYTLPYNIIWNGEYAFSNISILKMTTLGIIYLFLGTYFFQKRKMENAEESFSNDKVHLFVKALTLFPMMVVLNKIGLEGEETAFVIGLIVIYYFAYDFVVKRKIKFIKSVVSVILTMTILQGIVVGANKIFTEEERHKIKRTDVEKIAIEFESDNYHTSPNLKNSYFIDNKEIMNFVFESAYGAQNQYTYSIDKENYATNTIYVGLQTSKEKKYTISVELIDRDMDKLLELLEKDKNYVEFIKETYKKDSKIILGQIVLIGDEKQINSEIEKEIDNMSLKDIYKITRKSTSIFLNKMYYQNHMLKAKVVPIDMNNGVFKLVADNQND